MINTQQAFDGKNYTIRLAEGGEQMGENVVRYPVVCGQFILSCDSGNTEVFDTFQELVESHPTCEEARSVFESGD